jgi:ligand-binding SRPBCC domain-containing protein
MSTAVVTVTTRVAATPERVWAHARTMEGVNAELRPFVRMTVPSAVRGLTIDEAPLGEIAFHSVLLAGGLLPFDRHALCLTRVDATPPQLGFLEQSTSLLQRRWEHERTIVGDGAGSLVTDRVVFEPRLAPARLARPVVAALFRHRHRRLSALLARA